MGKTNIRTVGVVVILMFILFLALGGATGLYSTVSGKPSPTMLPVFANAECLQVTSEKVVPSDSGFDMVNAPTIKYGNLDYNAFAFKCNQYTDVCKVDVNRAEIGSDVIVYRCAFGASYDSIGDLNNKCVKLKQWGIFSSTTSGFEGNFALDRSYSGFPENKEIIVVVAHDRAGKLDGGEVRIKMRFTPYTLVSETGQNLATVGVGTCDLDLMHKATMPSLLASQTDAKHRLAFNREANYIDSYVIGNSGNVINYNGRWIYVHRVGFYYPIFSERGTDGNYYTDTRNEISASNIICMPSSLYCEGGTTIIDPKDKDCSSGFGIPAGYAPSANPKEVCTYSCTNGQLVAQTCKSVPTCGANEYMDGNYNCVKAGDYDAGSGEGTDVPAWFLILIAAVFVLFIGGVIVLAVV